MLTDSGPSVYYIYFAYANLRIQCLHMIKNRCDSFIVGIERFYFEVWVKLVKLEKLWLKACIIRLIRLRELDYLKTAT